MARAFVPIGTFLTTRPATRRDAERLRARRRRVSSTAMKTSTDAQPPSETGHDACGLCGDVTAAQFLHARCHPTAPLRVRKEGRTLILTCYLPACGREVVRLTLAEA